MSWAKCRWGPGLLGYLGPVVLQRGCQHRTWLSSALAPDSLTRKSRLETATQALFHVIRIALSGISLTGSGSLGCLYFTFISPKTHQLPRVQFSFLVRVYVLNQGCRHLSRFRNHFSSNHGSAWPCSCESASCGRYCPGASCAAGTKCRV